MALATRRKPNAHARKRHAGHHRQDKSYLRSYWPYLPMLLIVGLGIVINGTLSNSSVLGTKSDFSTAALLNTTNAERQKKNQPALRLNPQLSAAAQAKAEDMARGNYWSHNSPDGKTPWTFIDASGYQYQRAGENLAYGFASGAESVAGWMGSPEHRANILDISYQDVGFGVASAPDYLGEGPETIVVAEYGQPVGAAATTPSSSPVVPPSTTSTANVLGTEVQAQPVSRVQILAGDNSQWALVAVIIASAGAFTLFMLRHGYRMHRLISRGEAFVVHHPYIDVAIVLIITAGVILTRSSGIIR